MSTYGPPNYSAQAKESRKYAQGLYRLARKSERWAKTMRTAGRGDIAEKAEKRAMDYRAMARRVNAQAKQYETWHKEASL